MADRTLTLTADVELGIRRHGEATYPHECCGALVGRDGCVTACVPLPNTTEEGPRRRFLVRPSDYREAERQAAAHGGELLGFYHSHPDHPARPSQYDLDHAWPTFAYIIVSVADAQGLTDKSVAGATTVVSGRSAGSKSVAGAKAGDVTVWYLKDDRASFEEGTLHHAENTHPDAAPAVHR